MISLLVLSFFSSPPCLLQHTPQAAESEMCPSFSAALTAGKPVYTSAQPSLADGLAVPKVSSTKSTYSPINLFLFYLFSPPQVGGNAFATARGCVDKVCIVNEDDIALAILRLVEVEKSVVEGAGATGLAACLSGQLDETLAGKK